MNELGRKANEIKSMLGPMVAMFVAVVTPSKDEISMSQAYKLYGRKWVDTQREYGNITTRVLGNRVLVSKAELECLLYAEREIPSSEL